MSLLQNNSKHAWMGALLVEAAHLSVVYSRMKIMNWPLRNNFI